MQDSEKYIEELLKLFTQYSKLVEEAFENDSRFLTSRDKVKTLKFNLVHTHTLCTCFTCVAVLSLKILCIQNSMVSVLMIRRMI